MLLFGYISEVNETTGLYRVEFRDLNIVSPLISSLYLDTIETKDENYYSIKQHVAVLMKKNFNEGVILGAVYDKKTSPATGNKKLRKTTYKDGSFKVFNKDTGDYELNVKGDAVVTSNKKAKINATSGVELNGNSNGGLLKVTPTVAKINALETEINNLKTLITAWVVAPGDGGAALKAVLAAWSSTPMTPTVNANVENTQVKH